MKILYNPGRFNGGAPLSLLEYADIAKDIGHNVFAIGEYATCQDEYSKLEIQTIETEWFLLRKPFKAIKNILEIKRIINIEKPDLIHATSYGIIPSKFISLFCGIPTIYSIAGGNKIKDKVLNGIFKDERLIVYSEENKEDLLKLGYSSEKIIVISNRLRIHKGKTNNNSENEVKKLLLISRLDKDLYSSVKTVIGLVDSIADKNHDFILDIIGGGVLQNEVEEIARHINYKRGRELILVHGYQNDADSYIENSQIVFGKGRSIIEAVLNNKISIVISGNGDMSLCQPETIDNLYRYNFSGRKIKKTLSSFEFQEILEKVYDSNLDSLQLDETKEIVDKLYNIDHAKERIKKIYDEYTNKVNKKNTRRFSAIVFLAKVYVNTLKRKF